MIKTIHVKNYILIDDLSVDFSDRFNVITGETGAGKSILINAIDIAFGAKINSDVIKKNADKALIELFISTNNPAVNALLKEYEIDCSDEIILVREIMKNSSRTRVNGTLVNQNFIKELKDLCLDIHSQHQTYTFMQPKSHIGLLDNYAKDSYGKELDEYKNLYKQYQNLLQKLEEAKSKTDVSKSQLDFLKFQIEEIDNAKIEDIEEDSKLENELSVLQNAEKLKELTYSAYWALNGDDNSMLDAIMQIKSNLSKAVDYDKDLSELESSFIEFSEMARELSSNLRDYSSSVENNTERLNEIQERLYLLDKLKRKYGNSLESILETYNNLTKELESIDCSENLIIELNNKIDSILKELNTLADDISQKRKNYAEVLSQLVVDELEKLELPKSKFEIRIQPIELSILGKDNVEFYISTNISQDLLPLAQVASGGEISRVMLAIKTIFAKSDDIDTVIFDEIDTGISGKASQSVADEIVELAKYRQIILITHQAIIASKADKHFYVNKIQDDTTNIEIKTLSNEERINAIASLASGETTDSAIDFAKSLLMINN
ncbi:DNA repair protein RecN [bacterium]|nr:DNA repair protein RecN [bacterium]